MNDNILMMKMANGDQEALAKLINKHQKFLYNFVKRRGGREDTDEIVQDVFLILFQRANKFQTNHSFLSWMTTIAANRTIDFVRKRGRRRIVNIEDEDLQCISVYNQPDELEHTETNTKLMSLMNELQPIYRKVLSLYYLENLDYVGIANRLNIPLGTVKSRIYIAKKQMLELIESSEL